MLLPCLIKNAVAHVRFALRESCPGQMEVGQVLRKHS